MRHPERNLPGDIPQRVAALIAIGGGHGTLSEMALGLHFNRPVLALGNTPPVDGATLCQDAGEALARLAGYILRGQGPSLS